jgi:hypothetical protein
MKLFIFREIENNGCAGIIANNKTDAISIGNHYKKDGDYIGIFYENKLNKKLNHKVWILEHEYRLHMMVDEGVKFIYHNALEGS